MISEQYDQMLQKYPPFSFTPLTFYYVKMKIKMSELLEMMSSTERQAMQFCFTGKRKKEDDSVISNLYMQHQKRSDLVDALFEESAIYNAKSQNFLQMYYKMSSNSDKKWVYSFLLHFITTKEFDLAFSLLNHIKSTSSSNGPRLKAFVRILIASAKEMGAENAISQKQMDIIKKEYFRPEWLFKCLLKDNQILLTEKLAGQLILNTSASEQSKKEEIYSNYVSALVETNTFLQALQLKKVVIHSAKTLSISTINFEKVLSTMMLESESIPTIEKETHIPEIKDAASIPSSQSSVFRPSVFRLEEEESYVIALSLIKEGKQLIAAPYIKDVLHPILRNALFLALALDFIKKGRLKEALLQLSEISDVNSKAEICDLAAIGFFKRATSLMEEISSSRSLRSSISTQIDIKHMKDRLQENIKDAMLYVYRSNEYKTDTFSNFSSEKKGAIKGIAQFLTTKKLEAATAEEAALEEGQTAIELIQFLKVSSLFSPTLTLKDFGGFKKFYTNIFSFLTQAGKTQELTDSINDLVAKQNNSADDLSQIAVVAIAKHEGGKNALKWVEDLPSGIQKCKVYAELSIYLMEKIEWHPEAIIAFGKITQKDQVYRSLLEMGIAKGKMAIKEEVLAFIRDRIDSKPSVRFAYNGTEPISQQLVFSQLAVAFVLQNKEELAFHFAEALPANDAAFKNGVIECLKYWQDSKNKGFKYPFVYDFF